MSEEIEVNEPIDLYERCVKLLNGKIVYYLFNYTRQKSIANSSTGPGPDFLTLLTRPGPGAFLCGSTD